MTALRGGISVASRTSRRVEFLTEYRNAVKISEIVSQKGIRGVHVPKMYGQHCTSKVVVMEWIEGIKITNTAELNRRAINPRSVGLALLRLFAELVMVQGFVHGDLHPGNLMVRSKGRRSFFQWLFRGSRQPFELVLLDHGTYLTVDPKLRELFCQLWCAFVMMDKSVQNYVCYELGGDQGCKVLPLLLTHQATSWKEQRRLQKSVGVNDMTDVTQLMSVVSRDFLELLRISSVVKGVTSQLNQNQLMSTVSRDFLELLRISSSV
eukprot:gene25755-11419_t